MRRRRQYRVRTEDLPFVLRLLIEGRSPLPIRVDDLTIQGALIRLPSQEEPLQTGAVVRLEVVGIAGRQLDVAARVVRSEQREGTVAYGIMFLEPAAIEARLTPDIARLFNRRRTPRTGVEGVQAIVSGPSGRWAVNVRDISYDAVSLHADAPPPPMAEGDRVIVRVGLPGEVDVVQLAGVLGSRPEPEGGSRVIVHFDQDEGNEEARERLLRYVGARIRDES